MVYLQELHDRLAEDSADPESYNQISTLVDIAMEFIAPNMELRHGNPIELSRQVSHPLLLPWFACQELSHQVFQEGFRAEHASTRAIENIALGTKRI